MVVFEFKVKEAGSTTKIVVDPLLCIDFIRTELQFAIGSMWNGDPISKHNPIRIELEPLDENNNVKVTVRGKFFDQLPAPPTPPGKQTHIFSYLYTSTIPCVSFQIFRQLR